ncbi:MAG TPA: cell division protein ZapE [Dokdonella sp.]
MSEASSPPSLRYREGAAARRWDADPAQERVLPELDRLHAALAPQAERPRALGRLRSWLGARAPATPVRGLYLWGGVGRGKTFLMDLFVDACPPGVALRRHFHRFMRDVHAELRALGERADPLDAVAGRLSREARVLCLDEFQVTDIGDAMILGNLLRGLFERGVVLVTTSNTQPADLYKDGLQRERFLPAIALLERHCEIVELASAHDWRLRALKQAPLYHVPPGSEAERAMAATFRRVTRGASARREFALAVNGREISVRCEADGAVWFEFAALCEGPRAVADYIELAKAYSTILVSNVPQFTPSTDDAARRFIELVDELYDRGVKLVLSAAAPIVDLYDGARLRAEFARTESRLIEMQSEEYLAREHRR